VHTYHCTSCSHLLLASTHIISSLPTRRAPGLDNATIVPLPAPPKAAKPATSSTEEAESESDDEGDEQSGYTLLLTLTRDRAAKVIAREDGFEKRALWRCGRCKLVVGYMLDEAQYAASKGKEKAAKDRFLYLLPGAVTESSELGKEQEPVELV
jgi:hypothetical protein